MAVEKKRIVQGLRANLIAITIVASSIASGVALADRFDYVVEAAKEDVAAGRCQQAVNRLSAIDGLASRAMLAGGRCQIEQGRYAEGLADLVVAREGGDLPEAQLSELALYEGVALYHLERYDEARTALSEVDASLIDDPAELSLYRGLVQLRRGENARAAESLEMASRMDPERTEPIASYYAGIAWLAISERTKARAAFQRVVDLDEGGQWGRPAAAYLESTELYPFFARVSAGFEYDDNVLLRARGTPIPPDDGGSKDWRAVLAADAGVQLFEVDDWAGGLLGSFYITKQFELEDFDTQFPTIGIYLDHQFDAQTVGRLRYDFGYAWVDYKSFARTQSAQASLFHIWDEAGATEVTADYTWNDFRFRNEGVVDADPPPPPATTCPIPTESCSPFGVNETKDRDRDGYGLGLFLEHRYMVPIIDAVDEVVESFELRGNYRFGWYDSQGTEWDGFTNIFTVGFAIELPWEVSFDAQAGYERYDYRNPSTYPDIEFINVPYVLPDSDREENAVAVAAELEKDLTEYISLSTRYSYYDIDSNTKVYTYRRHIVGAYVNFRFD